MRNKSRFFTGLVGVAFIGVVAGTASADPALRKQVAQRGDFILVGNTLAHDCAAPAGVVTVGTLGACGSNTVDTAPDVYWQAGNPAGGATADISVVASAARSTAELTLPANAVVTNAYLYWAASRSGGSTDTDVTLDGPNMFSTSVTGMVAGETPVGALTHYQVVSDITSTVQAQGSGAYSVSAVNAIALANVNQSVAFSGWWLVVFYKDPALPPRNLALFDGLDFVFDGSPQTSTISGFVVPGAGFTAKLGVVAYDGDATSTGEALQWDMATLSDALNPADNFFNSTRSLLGAAESNAGDLPRLTGAAQSMSGIDLDVVQVPNNLLSPGQTSAAITAVSSVDTYLLGAFITSISTLLPDLSTSTKSVTDLNGGGVAPGDILEYTIVVANTGDDDAAGVVMNDIVPTGVTYLPGSIQVTQGPNTGAKTDMAGDDQGEYDAGTETVTVRLGTGADAAQGGTLAIGQSTTVKFQVTVDPTADGLISNQAVVTAMSPAGGAPQDYPTDGNGMGPGEPPTDVVVDSDNDGISNGDETAVGTDPNDADTDDDGVGDGDEPFWDMDSDGDGLINALDVDSDNDGLYDGTELGLGCNGPDTDAGAGHCVPDADSGATTTDPLDADTDDGGVSDGGEDTDLDGAIDAGETDPTAGHGADDSLNLDDDSDGLTNGEEGTLGTDPNDADTDDDGVPDGSEPNPADDNDGDGLINALDVDSDNDGLYDGTELGFDCSGPGTDMGAGHCIADGDGGATTTNPLDPDTDDGGVSDGSEDTNQDGVIDPGETDPTAGHGADDNINADNDGDGLSNGLEGSLGSDPNDADSDDDGAADGAEANLGDDTDGDGIINVLDPDSDNDGLFDGTELGFDCSNPDTDAGAGSCTPDGDNGATTTSPLDPDTDDGGVSDGIEDADHDGVIDAGETDPNDPADDVPCQQDSDCGGPMSGMVCDDGTKVCIEGCRGMGGNGCPTDETCTSMDTTIGECVTGAGGGGGSSASSSASSGTGAGGEPGTGGNAVDDALVQGGGCACSLPAGDDDRTSSWTLLIAGAVAVALRRGRRRR